MCYKFKKIKIYKTINLNNYYFLYLQKTLYLFGYLCVREFIKSCLNLAYKKRFQEMNLETLEFTCGPT